MPNAFEENFAAAEKQGGGASTGGLVNEAYKLLSLQDLQNKIKNQPLETQKLQGEIAQQQASTLNKNQDNTKNAFLSAVTGNFQSANDSLQALGAPYQVAPHPDPIKRNMGLVVAIDNNTGQASEIDPYAESKINKQIDLQADLIKSRTNFNMQEQKSTEDFIRNKAIELHQSGAFPDVRSAMNFTQSLESAVKKQEQPYSTTNPQTGKTEQVVPKPMADLPPEALKAHLQAETEINLASQMPQQRSNDPLAVDIRPRTAIPETDRRTLSDMLGTMKSINGNILPKALEVNDSLIGKSYAGNTINDLLSSRRLESRQVTALKSLTGQGFFNYVTSVAGTTFTEGLLDQIKPLQPNVDDTMDQMIAKISAVNATIALNANGKLDALQANRHDVNATRQLFTGSIPAVPGNADTYQNAARTVLNNLPDYVKNNRAVVSQMIDYMPAPIRDAIDKQLSGQGKPRAAGTLNKFDAINQR